VEDVGEVRRRRWDDGRTDKGGAEGLCNLTPLDANPSGTGGGHTKTALCFTLEPCLCPLVISQVGLELLQASAIVVPDPLLLVLGERTILDHLGLYGDAGESLEPKPTLAVEIVFRFDSSHGKGGFNTNTPLTGKVWGRRSVTFYREYIKQGSTHRNLARS